MAPEAMLLRAASLVFGGGTGNMDVAGWGLLIFALLTIGMLLGVGIVAVVVALLRRLVGRRRARSLSPHRDDRRGAGDGVDRGDRRGPRGVPERDEGCEAPESGPEGRDPRSTPER